MYLRSAPLFVAAALVLTAADAASAGWTVTGAGAAGASAAVLAPPTATTVTWDPTVHVSWTSTTSSWATGHRVLRAVAPDGPYTQIADLPLGSSTVDDAPGAGTHYYTVVAYRAGWTSARSPVAARSDRTYVLTGAAPSSTTGCAAANSITGMQQGFVPSGTGVSASLGTTTYSFCTQPWTTGQTLPAGTTTMTAYVENTNKNACSVIVELSVGGTSLGSATVSVPGLQSAGSPLTWSVATAAASPTTGQRVTFTLRPQGGGGCNNSTIYGGGAATPASVTLTG
jgi:hypothetical protein